MVTRVRVFDVTFFVLSVVAASLHVVGLVFPSWWYIDDPNDTGTSDVTYFGIWATVTCQNNTCVMTASNRSGTRAWLQGVAVIETLAAALLLLNIITQGVIVHQHKTVSLLRRLVVIFTAGSGVVIAVGVLLFVKKKAGLTPMQALETRDGTTGWPLVLSSVGAAVSFCVGVAMGIGQLTVFDEGKDDEVDEKSASQWQEKVQQLNEL